MRLKENMLWYALVHLVKDGTWSKFSGITEVVAIEVHLCKWLALLWEKNNTS